MHAHSGFTNGCNFPNIIHTKFRRSGRISTFRFRLITVVQLRYRPCYTVLSLMVLSKLMGVGSKQFLNARWPQFHFIVEVHFGKTTHSPWRGSRRYLFMNRLSSFSRCLRRVLDKSSDVFFLLGLWLCARWYFRNSCKGRRCTGSQCS